MRFRAPILLLLLLCTPSFCAFALPGESAAVLEQCGAPTSQNRDVSPVNARDELNLQYGDLILHFTPMDGSWSFTSAWRNHLPVTRNELERQMPCFQRAMQAAANAPLPAVDPTIARETATVKTADFGIPYFWLIVVLTIALLIVGLWPRKLPANERVLVERPVRRPAVFMATRHDHYPDNRPIP